MKSTSFGSSLVSRPASAPLCSMAGPLVVCSCDAHLVREDVRERRLAEAGRAAEEDVIERLAAAARRLDEDPEVVLVLALPDVLVERGRPKEPVEAGVVRLFASPENARFL